MEIKCLGWREKSLNAEDKELRPEKQWTPVPVIANLSKVLTPAPSDKTLSMRQSFTSLGMPCSCHHGASSCLEFCILLLASQN